MTEHAHEHEGHHCTDPNCSCHGHHHHHDGDGEQVISDALIYSRTGHLKGGDGLSLEAAVARVRPVLLDICARASIGGVFPGHIKALIRNSDGGRALSVTREGVCDIAPAPGASASESWELTVNIISAVSPQGDVTGLLDGLFL